jgi:hypothetical protein
VRAPAASGGRPADYGQPQPSGPRPAHSPGRYAGGTTEPATDSIAALARMGNKPSSIPAVVPPATPPRPQARPVPPPPPLDDDPLTSPSFPAVNTSDSRSYRTRRSDSNPGSAAAAAAHREPAQQPRSYPSSPPDRTISPPNGYPAQPGAPAGNPYGSFVSQPAASYQPEPPLASPETASHGKHASRPQPQPAPAASGWYGGEYLSAPPVTGGQDQAGYQPGYQDGQSDQVAYAQPGYANPQYDQRGYAAQDPNYGLEGYQGYQQGYGNNGY